MTAVGSELVGVERHHGEGVLARLFAELGEDGDVAADEGLQASANGAEQVAGERTTMPRTTPMLRDNAVAGDFEGSGGRELGRGKGLGLGRSTFGFYLSGVLREIVR